MGSVESFTPGLAGVIAAETRLSRVDGRRGELLIRGFPLEELAAHATFEEVLFLLWQDRLPDRQELAAFTLDLAAYRSVPPATIHLLRAAAAADIPAMDALRMSAGTLDLAGLNQINQQALALVAMLPGLVAAYARLSQGQEPIAPRLDLGHSASYLHQLTGAVPHPARVRALDTYLITVSDHGLNASTFAARVIVSTQSDLISAIVGAIGALKGPIHGGAPGPALDMVFEIGSSDRAEPFLRAKLEAGERLMGFGHRVYKVKDPRAVVLAAAAKEMYLADGDMELYQLARHVEQTAVSLLAVYKPGRQLQTNVEYYTALLLHGLGLPTSLFTPTFAIGRVGGWLAHCFEQRQDGRLLRPSARYLGATNRSWQPLEQR